MKSSVEITSILLLVNFFANGIAFFSTSTRLFPFLFQSNVRPAATQTETENVGTIHRFNGFLPRFVSTSQFQALNARVNTLQAAIKASMNPRCTPDAISMGAKMVGGACLTIETVSQNYEKARMICFDRGGKLAEPSFNDNSFFANLKKVFPEEVRQIRTTPIMIGASGKEQTNNANASDYIIFSYNSNGVVIPADDGRWLIPEKRGTGPGFTRDVTTGLQEVAVILPPFSIARDDTPWHLDREIFSSETTRPFICQYDVI